jgi:hypothetical protein
MSSGQTLSDACNFDVLAIEEGTAFTFDQEYKIGEYTDVDRRFVTNSLIGLQTLSTTCLGELRTTLDYKTSDGRWEILTRETYLEYPVDDYYNFDNSTNSTEYVSMYDHLHVFGLGLVREGDLSFFSLNIDENVFEAV